MHENSRNLCKQFVDHLVISCVQAPRVADVGSYDVNGSYRDLFERPGWTYKGFDIRGGPNVDYVLASPEHWCLPEYHQEAFDVVISGQCMEHVAAPWRWIKNVASLCRPGGLIWLSVPNTEIFHEHPIDCWRVWPDGMRAILSEANLQELICRVEGPDTLTIARKPLHKMLSGVM